MLLLLLLLLLTISSAKSAVLVSFDLVTSNTNPGPFSSGATITASLSLDDSVVPTGSSQFVFAGAADSLSIQINDPNLGNFQITGDNGNYTQQALGGGVTSVTGNFNPFATTAIGSLNNLQVVNPNKTNAGTTPFELTRVTFGFRVDSTLVPDPSVMLSNAEIGDFSLLDLTMYFSHPTASGVAKTSINHGQYFSQVSFSSNSASVSIPGGWALFVVGLVVWGSRRMHRAG